MVWAVPYIFSIALFPTGIMDSNYPLFKNLMTISGSIMGFIATLMYFKKEKKEIKNAWIAGIVWLIVNWLLDFAFLMPFTGYDFAKYFLEIGVAYLIIPIYPLLVVYSKK